MDSSSRIPSGFLWFETLSSHLTPSHPFHQHSNKYVVESIPLSLPRSTDRPYRPPSGYHYFFLDQLEGDLRLSVPTIYLRILSFYRIPLNQLALNAFRLLAGGVIVFRHLQLPLLPAMFHCFFQLKMLEHGVFYFIGRPNCQFLRDVFLS